MTLLMREQEIAEENFRKGIQQGIQQGIIKQIKALKTVNVDENKIIQMIVEDYGITEEEVRKYL